MSKTRAEMYQTVRDAREIRFQTVRSALKAAIEADREYGWVAECKLALATLAALEAQERDTERLLNVARGCHDYGGGYRDTKEAEIFHHGITTVINALTAFAKAPKELQVRVLEGIGASTPTAPPAAECAAREENAELTRLVNSYREEAANYYSLREPLSAELRQAVDALRPFAKWVIEQDDPRGRSHFVRYADCIPVAESGGVNATFGDFRVAAHVVAAFDAKQGEKS